MNEFGFYENTAIRILTGLSEYGKALAPLSRYDQMIVLRRLRIKIAQTIPSGCAPDVLSVYRDLDNRAQADLDSILGADKS